MPEGKSGGRAFPAQVGDPDGFDPGALFARAINGLKNETGTAGRWIPLAVDELQNELPQYPVLSLIGRGGMGAVYLARQDHLDRCVAIKILPPGIDGEDLQFAERFKQEARAMAKFSHPGIISVHDAGETPGGLLYFVMEYVDGEDLGKILADGNRLAPGEACRITMRVCEALAYAHERGVVHRDIKPSNVMIEADSTVKVADFGLAKLILQEGGFTRSDMALGSPDFSAPECSSYGMQPDVRADIYSLGVMFYRMLTGRVPRGRFEVPSRLVPELDARLDAIVDLALQTDRDKRYSSALEMKADVERAVSTKGVFPSSDQNIAGNAKKHSRALIVAIASVGMFAAGIGLWIVPQRGEAGIGTKPHTSGDAATATQPQWKKVDFTAVYPSITAPEHPNDVVLEDGLLHIHGWNRWKVSESLRRDYKTLQRNVAVRATLRMKSGANPTITLRSQIPAETQYVAAIYSRHIALIRQTGTGKEHAAYIGNLPFTRIPADGEEITFQFASVGNRLFVWFDGKFLGQVEDHMFDAAGEFGLQAYDGWFKSLEYILLDGIPEDAAMKLIGIETP